VANRLQSNLVYPEKMRRQGIEAVTTIAFTVMESGQIRRNSLEVRKSSGYREMDDNALRAARESAPFDKPPKEMALVIAVAFEVERARR
jgi:protein TonB